MASSNSNDKAQSTPPPRVPGLPLLGNTLQIADAPERFFVNAHKHHGAAFRVNMLFRDYTVLAGMEGFRFLKREGESYFSRGAFYDRFARELGTDHFLLGEPADKHTHLRGQMRLAFSRQVAAPYIPDMISVVDRMLDENPPGTRVTAMDFIAEIAFDQYSHVMCGRSLRDSFSDANHFACRIMNVGAKIWPEFTLGFPRYKRARKRVFTLMDELVAEYRANSNTEDREFTIMDALLAAQSDDGSPMATADQVACCLYGFVGTIVYMNRAIAFLIYDLLNNPEQLKRVTAEADALYANGTPTSLDLRSMSLLRAALKESMRLHPIALALPFVVEEDFIFEGYTIKRGEYCVISGVPGHFAEMFYTEPGKFDPDRCRMPRSEHRPKGAHVPFGFASRVCPAVGLVETIVLCTVTRLLHRRKLSMDPPDYELNTVLDPLPGPSRGFRLHLGEERKPLRAETSVDEWQRVASVLDELFDSGRMLRPAMRARLEQVQVSDVDRGDCIVREGDIADAFYVLVEGRVRVIAADGTLLANLVAGDHFGEIGLLGKGRRTATCNADTNVRLLRMERDAFLAIARDDDLVPGEIAVCVRQRYLSARMHQALPSLTAERLRSLAGTGELMTFEVGDTIIRQGDYADHFYILLSGQVAVVVDDSDSTRHVATLTAGDHFGEIGILEARPRTANVYVTEGGAAQTLAIPRDALLNLVEKMPEARVDIAATMLDRIIQVDTQ